MRSVGGAGTPYPWSRANFAKDFDKKVVLSKKARWNAGFWTPKPFGLPKGCVFRGVTLEVEMGLAGLEVVERKNLEGGPCPSFADRESGE